MKTVMLMMAMCLGMFACGNSNAKSNKATEEQSLPFLHIHCPKNSEKIMEAIFQFSRLMQYFTFGVSISPCISPASF